MILRGYRRVSHPQLRRIDSKLRNVYYPHNCGGVFVLSARGCGMAVVCWYIAHKE